MKEHILIFILTISFFIFNPLSHFFGDSDMGDNAFIQNFKNDINKPVDNDGNTSLIVAARNGLSDTIKELIALKADVDETNKSGETALMYATLEGRADIVKILIGAKANVNAVKNNGTTALIWATDHGNIDAVNALIDGGADIDKASNNGDTPLMIAAWEDRTGIVETLIKRGANPYLANRFNWTALMAAALKGKPGTVKAFIDAKINMDFQNKFGWTALMIAAGSGNTDNVKLLVDAKANIDARDKDNSSALMWAEQSYQSGTEDILIKAGAKHISFPEYTNTVNASIKTDVTKRKNKDSYYPGDTWRTSAPEAQGMDSEYLIRMLNYIDLNKLDIHSIVIIRNGYVVLEAYKAPFGKDNIHILKSCSKSVSSALIGIAIKKGCIKSTDQRVVPIFAGQTIKNLDDNKRLITIRHLLTMSSGISQQEVNANMPEGYMKSADWNRYYLDQPMAARPGALFAYDSAGVNLLMSILHKTSRMKNSDFADKFLFKPVGITNYYWQTDRQGDYLGGWGLAMTPMEMARFGYLYLLKGDWNGKQVIPSDWVKASMSSQIKPYNWISKDKGYGYLWWELEFGGFTAAGYGGQRIMVMPEKDMVVVITAGLINERPEEYLTGEFINRSIVSDTFIPGNSEKQARLAAAVSNLGYPANNEESVMPETAHKISGKKFIMEENRWNFHSIEFEFTGTNECFLEGDYGESFFISDPAKAKEPFKLRVGLDGKYRENVFASDLHKIDFSRGKWIGENAFVIEYYEAWDNSSKYQFTFRFDNKKLNVTAESKVGEWSANITGNMEQ